MAKKNQTAAEAAPVNPLLDAFTKFGGNTIVKELDGVWAKSPGAIIMGRISHGYSYTPKRPDGSGQRKQVLGIALVTTQPCNAVQDGDEFEFPAGSLIGVTIAQKLEGLLDFAPGSEVAIMAVREVDLGGGHSTWQYEVKCEGKKNARGSALRPTASVETEAPDAEASDAADGVIS